MKLNDILKQFWLSVKTWKNEFVKKNFFKSLRYGIKSYLKQEIKNWQNENIDIIDNPIFQTLNEVYMAMLVKLQHNGHSKAEHEKPINRETIEKLYTHHSITFNTSTPTGLQDKCYDWVEY